MLVVPVVLLVFYCQTTNGVPCDSEIYCKGTMYDTIQESGVIADFGYHRLLESPDIILKEFKGVQKDKVEVFVQKYFEAEKEDVDTLLWNLPDTNLSNAVLEKINDRNLALFAGHLINLLPHLAIRGSKYMSEHMDRYSLLTTDGFIRRYKDSREALYWDQYWLVNGLLVCEKHNTARALIDNLVGMLKVFGHVPRGNRIYYANRSHPPLLTPMAYNYFNVTNDRNWLNQNIEYLDKELMYWVNNKKVTITMHNKVYELYRYAVDCSEPRPESYTYDLRLSSEIADKAYFYRQIHSASESGWDISARWLFGQNGEVTSNLNDLFITRVVPVDLNAYLYRGFQNIAKMYDIKRDKVKQGFWARKTRALQEAIERVLWNNNVMMWNDYDMRLEQHREEFFISNLMPLWACAYSEDDAERYGNLAVEYLKKYRVLELYKGGIPVTLQETQESFDFPNSYTHLQVMVLQGLRNTRSSDAERYASILFTNWLDAVLSCWSETRSVFDSYNAVEFGQHMTYNDWNEDYSITVGAFLEILGDYYILDRTFYNAAPPGGDKSYFIIAFSMWNVIIFLK